jgi:hypothetical protein
MAPRFLWASSTSHPTPREQRRSTETPMAGPEISTFAREALVDQVPDRGRLRTTP